MDYDTELADHKQALAQLKQRDDVDPNRIVIFGGSIGGTYAPLIAAAPPTTDDGRRAQTTIAVNVSDATRVISLTLIAVMPPSRNRSAMPTRGGPTASARDGVVARNGHSPN